MFRILLCMALYLASCWAQGARIFIVTDLEGAGGVNDPDEQLLPGQRRYVESRAILTGEVNAAVEGAIAAGAAEVVIWDGHDGSRTLSINEIDKRARLIQGKPTPANYYMGPKAYDGVFFVGQHAMAGAKNGVLAHSQSFSVKRIAINGKDVGEIGQTAAIAGYFDIPVIFLAGDQAACDEITALQPGVMTVAVKRLAGQNSTSSLSHDEAKRRIKEATQKAVANVKEYHPWKLSGPVEMTIEYHPQPPVHPTARTLRFTGQTVLEAYEAWLGKP
jgi:D-amino peptidase